MIEIDETTSSFNETFGRRLSSAQITEARQEIPPISPNKKTFANLLSSCETPYIREKSLTGSIIANKFFH